MRQEAVAIALLVGVTTVLMPALAPAPDSLELRPRSVSSSRTDETCSSETLAGKWGLSFEGVLLGPIPLTSFTTPGQVAVVAVLDVDGAGSFTGTGRFNVGGASASQSGTGTYVVNPDCSGTGTFDYGDWEMGVSFVITGDGAQREVRFVNSSQPAVFHGRIQKL